jgi:hypothetical protein
LFSSGRFVVENAPFALAGSIPAAGSLDPRKAWNMGESTSSSGEILKDQRSAVEVMAETAHDKPPLPSAFTLRVKPDRRRVQLPIPGGHDRRRPR